MNNIRTFATYANRYLVKHAKAFPLKAIISSPFMNYTEREEMDMLISPLLTSLAKTMKV